jgi:hypothetical protein
VSARKERWAMEKLYRLKDLIALTGTTARRAHYYRHLLTPYKITGGSGRGAIFKYSWQNVIEMAVIDKLADLGITFVSVKALADDCFRNTGFGPGRFGDFVFLNAGDDDCGVWLNYGAILKRLEGKNANS